MSICEDDKFDVALGVEELAKKNGVELVMAPDAIIANEFKNDAEQKVAPSNEIPEGWEGLDAGPEAQKKFAEAIKGCRPSGGMVLLAYSSSITSAMVHVHW